MSDLFNKSQFLKTVICPWKILEKVLENGLSEVERTMDIVGALLSYIVVAQWFNCEERYID